MSRHTTMVLVDTFQILDEFDLTMESCRESIIRLIIDFKDEYADLISSYSCDDLSEDSLQEAVIGFLEPERLIQQVKKYSMKNIQDAKEQLKIADYLLKKYNVTISTLLAPENFKLASREEYNESIWKAADALNLLCGRESLDLNFYDLTDSSSRVSEAQMKSIMENPEVYSLVPICYKY